MPFFFCYLQELLILFAAEQKSKSESKQLVMSFQWPISMKLRAKTSRRRQHQPSEFISKGSLCLGAGVPTRGPELGGSSRGTLGPYEKVVTAKGHAPSGFSVTNLHCRRSRLVGNEGERVIARKAGFPSYSDADVADGIPPSLSEEGRVPSLSGCPLLPPIHACVSLATVI